MERELLRDTNMDNKRALHSDFKTQSGKILMWIRNSKLENITKTEVNESWEANVGYEYIASLVMEDHNKICTHKKRFRCISGRKCIASEMY